MKKTNRFALALVAGVLASALMMGCGGGEAEDTSAPAGGVNGAASNGAAGNAANGAAGNGAAAQ